MYNRQKIASNIYNNNKASSAKIGQNVNKAVYFFARFFRVNIVVCFDSILPKYTSTLLFSGINPSPERVVYVIFILTQRLMPVIRATIRMMPD
jgi:hypothetical protein